MGRLILRFIVAVYFLILVAAIGIAVTSCSKSATAPQGPILLSGQVTSTDVSPDGQSALLTGFISPGSATGDITINLRASDGHFSDGISSGGTLVDFTWLIYRTDSLHTVLGCAVYGTATCVPLQPVITANF